MKAKRFVAACSMAAVILSSSAALASVDRYPQQHGLWWHGVEDGVIKSDYKEYDYTYAVAMVQNYAGTFVRTVKEEQAQATVNVTPVEWYEFRLKGWHWEGYSFNNSGY